MIPSGLAPAERTSGTHATDHLMSSHTILVVDNNPATRRNVTFALSVRGHRVLEAPDGQTALELMEREQPVLVLQGITLPDVDGFQLVSRLRQRARDQVAILALCGFSSSVDDAHLAAAGFDDVIIKPLEPSRLITIVEGHLPLDLASTEHFGAGLRLVLADDDPIQLKLVSHRLEKLGFVVETASDGEEAIRLVSRQPPDAVVSDVLMPHLDGFGLALALRQNPALARLPLLLVTSSYVEQSDRDFARRAGADELVLRTPDQRELIQSLRALLAVPRTPDVLAAHEVPELEKERTKRAVLQLERHVVMNAGLARRCSALSAELTVLAGISQAVLKHQNIETALEVALASCLDAGGVSLGALYLLESDGAFRVRPLGSHPSWGPGDLESFFGEPAILRDLVRRGTTVTLPFAAPAVTGEAETVAEASAAEAVVRRSGGKAAMVVPLIHEEQPLGALFMVAHGRELEQEDWLTFAQGVGSQIAQALALAAALAQRETAERDALESRAEWRALAEHAPDIIARVNREGTIQFINRTAPPRRPEDLLGKNWLLRVPPEYHPGLSAALHGALTSGEPSTHEIMVPTPENKTDWFSCRIGPVLTDGEITGAIVISRQITQKKQEEAQLIVADRMASVGTLAGGVAHEINNPLAAVIANLDLAHRDAVELAERFGNRDLMDYLRDAQQAAERVRLIVRDLKVFSRVEEDRASPTDLRSVLDSTLRMAWNEIRLRARLVKDFVSLPPVEANESRLGQVFLNLIINATQSIPAGEVERNEIRVVTRMAADDMIAVDVIDTGVGMSPDIQKRLFTPFFTTKPAGVGTGLGLSICQRLVTAMGGTIGVRSKVGEGSTFTVLLPRAKPQADPSAALPPVAGPQPGPRRRGRVLVIDDEEPVAMAIRRALIREHDVVYASSARVALQTLKAADPFDVILCDLMMPEMTGMDLHRELSSSSPETAQRIVFVTGGAFTRGAQEFLEEVPNLRVEKPFNIQHLRALINHRVA